MNPFHLGAIMRSAGEQSARAIGMPSQPVYLRHTEGRTIDARTSAAGEPVDVYLSPQPDVATLDERIVEGSQGLYKSGDRVFQVSGLAATQAQVEGAEQVVWGTEVLRIVTRTPIEVAGIRSGWRIVAGIER